MKIKNENRKRPYRISVHLNEKEWNYFQKQLEKSKLSMEAYLRHRIRDYEVKIPPTRDYKRIYEYISAVGNNINQITRMLHQGEDWQLFRRQLLLYMDEIYKFLDRNV